ncbi:MAG: hypothetical protein WKF47_11500 [Geodermatophilaceae bacterium]
MQTVAHHVVRGLLRRGDFRRLLGTRLSGQFADGVFQASLAGAVLFNPERAATPADVAAGFAILLLPYSLVGPFAGVLLDRWDRRSVLLVANLVRSLQVVGVAGLLATGVGGGWLYLAALTVLAVNRFVLSALSAALPHVARGRRSGHRERPDHNPGRCPGGDRSRCGPWPFGGGGRERRRVRRAGGVLHRRLSYGSGGLARRLHARPTSGPDTVEGHARSTVRDVVIGLVAGMRHIAAHPPAVGALAVLTISPRGVRPHDPRDPAAVPELFRVGGLLPVRDRRAGPGPGDRRGRRADCCCDHAADVAADRQAALDTDPAGAGRHHRGDARPAVRTRAPVDRRVPDRGSRAGGEGLRGHGLPGTRQRRLPRPGLLGVRHAVQSGLRRRIVDRRADPAGQRGLAAGPDRRRASPIC